MNLNTGRPLNIMITGVGGPTPRSFARAIKEIGRYKNAKLIATDIHPYAVGLYQSGLFDKSVITPNSSEAYYWPFMEQLIREEQIDIAVILPEQEVLAWSERQDSGILPCKALIPPKKATEEMLDKGRLTAALVDTGWVPNSVLIDVNDPSLKVNSESVLKYPYWIRSATGSSGLGSYKIENFSDLQRWVAINKGINNFIASDYLPGRNLACKFLYYNGKLLRTACAERVNYIMAKVAPSGITGNTSFGRLINDQHVRDRALEAIERMFTVTGAERHGFYTVDMKEDAQGVPMITEINVRHVAFTQCLAMAGANLCEDTIRVLCEDPDFDYKYKHYTYEEGLIFLRDVDERPIVMKESELISIDRQIIF
jgi:hypothetical protein